jgi:hypothetical protein
VIAMFKLGKKENRRWRNGGIEVIRSRNNIYIYNPSYNIPKAKVEQKQVVDLWELNKWIRDITFKRGNLELMNDD